MSSDRTINYILRPAKNVERKMIKDVLSRLFPFGGTELYQYIGFGAKYFVDFSLFHKQLHINDMVSIERNTGNKNAYEFNRPFNCIKMMYGHSNDVLPKLRYEKRTIAWLDNDRLLSSESLSDITTLVSRAKSGSVIIISYNSRPPKVKELKERYNSDKDIGLIKKMLIDQVGEEHIPVGFIEDGLAKWSNYSKVLANIILNQIKEQISIINFSKEPDDRKNFKQILYFDYNDNVEMSTLGIIVYDGSDAEKIQKCCFDSFDFVRSTLDQYKIDVPNFTYKEMSYLYANMPTDEASLKLLKLDDQVFPSADVLKFSRFYKYFPNFFESELN